MFSFMKKDKADKRDKKERKDAKRPLSRDLFGAVGGSSSSGVGGTTSGSEKLTADELHRLDEVRRSLKIRTRRKEKEKLPSGITADYTANLGLNLEGWPDDDKTVQLGSPTSDGSGNSEVASLNSLTMKSETPQHPLPPSRGILKGKSSYGFDAPPAMEELDDDNKLVENTLRNELIIYEKPPSVLGSARKPPTLPKRNVEAEPMYSVPRPLGRVTPDPGLVPVYERKPPTEPPPPPPVGASPSASPRDHEATQEKPFVWTEPPGEGSGWFDHHRHSKLLEGSSQLSLPSLSEAVLPDARELVVQRKETGDFGFSLRRSVVVERSSNDPSRYSPLLLIDYSHVIDSLVFRNSVKRTVIFAEPVGSAQSSSLLNYRQHEQQASDALALLPGDRLLEVNGQNVQDKSREEIIDIIRHSGSSVALRVRHFMMTRRKTWRAERGRFLDVTAHRWND